MAANHTPVGHQASGGFTLIEMMVAVAIVAVLTAVALVAYNGHIEETRVLEAKEMLLRIKTRQEMYYQAHDQYVSAPLHPPASTEFIPRRWRPAPNAWAALNLEEPNGGVVYFSFSTTGLAAGTSDAISAALGLDTTVPSCYVRAQADMDENPATQPMSMTVGSQQDKVLVRNKDQ